MTEMVQYQPNLPTLAGQPRRLIEWAQEAAAAHDLAVTLAATAFCPDTFRGKPGEATAAILAGSEVGLSPMAALNAYDVIQGRPAPKAITLRALVQSAGHDIWIEQASADKVVMKGQRKGSAHVQQSEWTMKRARDAKLTTKSNWTTQPQNMLTARATAEISRLVGSDVILGIPYSSEELADLEPEPTTTVQRSTTRRAQRAKPEPIAVPEPDLDPPEPVIYEASGVDEFTPAGYEPITGPQMKKLHALLNEKGYGDRDAGLSFLSSVVGRDVDTSKSLSKDEARRVIDTLENPATEPPVDEPDADVDALWNGGQS